MAGLALLLALFAAPLAARGQGSFTLGGGVATSSLSSSLIQGGSGGGYEFSFGYRFATILYAVPSGRLSMETLVTSISRRFETLPVGYPDRPSFPADSASFALLAFGFRFDLLDPSVSRWSPWLGVGAGLATLTWETYAHGGGTVAPLLSVGVDVELLSGLLLRARLSTLSSSDASGGGLSYQAASLGLTWEFHRPAHHRRPEARTGPG